MIRHEAADVPADATGGPVLSIRTVITTMSCGGGSCFVKEHANFAGRAWRQQRSGNAVLARLETDLGHWRFGATSSETLVA